MTNLCLFIRDLLEWPFSELFFSDTSLWNQYKFVDFNVFSRKILIISCKMLIITVISNETTNELTIYDKFMSKRNNILPTRDNFSISSAGKIKSVAEFKIKLFK